MKRVVLIPSYEPQDTLVKLVKEVSDTGLDIVVVDDGGGAKYTPVFAQTEPYAKVLSYPENHGKGYALKTGYKYIQENCGECVIVTMDGDGQHLVSDAVKLLDCAGAEPGTLYIGSRVLKKDAPLRSRFGNGVTRNVYNMVTGVKVYDTQSGLRAFTSDMLPLMLSIEGDRYEYEMNVLLELAKRQIPMKEMPIQTIYLDATNSVSHFDTVKDSARVYGEIFKYIGSSLASFVVDYILYSLLLFLTGGLTYGLQISNYGARCISSIFNFTINKKVVFKSDGKLYKEALEYALLAFAVITVNTVLLSLITAAGMNAYIAKIVVEIIMFILNYLVQHFFIFKGKKA